MAHSSEMTWRQASEKVAMSSEMILRSLTDAEDIYLELNEVYNYAGGSDQLLADLLFTEEIQIRGVSPFEANAEEVAKIVDLKAAIQALHQLYECLNNVVTTQADRATLLRRMS